MNEGNKKFVHGIILAVLLSGLLVGIALAANSVILNGYQIDFLPNTVENANGLFTYAITADGDEGQGGGLSHWTLEIATTCGYEIVAPPDTSNYVTPTNHPACTSTYSCLSGTYEVVYGPDPTTGVDGIKFNVVSDGLSQDNLGTHIFQIEVNRLGGDPINVGDIALGVKTGSGETTGLISGPACDPTAVNLASFKASSIQNLAGGLILVTVSFASLVGMLVIWRRRQAG